MTCFLVNDNFTKWVKNKHLIIADSWEAAYLIIADSWEIGIVIIADS